MREIDELAAALVKVAVLIIALPLKTANWVVKVARRLPKKLRNVGLGQWKRKNSKKSPVPVAKTGGKNRPSALDKFKLWYEELPTRKRGKNGRKL